MYADLAGPGEATAPPWLTSVFEQNGSADPSGPPAATCSLAGRTTSPAAAREFAARILADWGLPHLIADVQLVVSELVTNALRHALAAGPASGSPILLRLVRHRSYVGCGVSDDGDGAPALVAGGDDLSESGRGLHLVDALSSAWGWLPVEGGKVVWALFDAGGGAAPDGATGGPEATGGR